MIFLSLKVVHILSAIILFGLGMGSVFYKLMADNSANVAAIAVTNRTLVRADFWFITPAVLIQPISGILMANIKSIPLTTDWLLQTYWLYILVGIFWLPVLFLQIKMRDLALLALQQNTALPACYQRYARTWLWLGVPAFFAMIGITVMMVFHAPLL